VYISLRAEKGEEKNTLSYPWCGERQPSGSRCDKMGGKKEKELFASTEKKEKKGTPSIREGL